MFGHQDDKKDDDKSSEKDTTIVPDQPADETVNTDTADRTEPTDDAGAPSAPPTTDVSIDDDGAWQHPGAPLDDEKDEAPKPEEDEDKNPAPINDIIGANAGPSFKPLSQDFGGHADNTPHELIDVKQKALHDLTPLVGKLDQPPEDKFRTIMMMIQASDDQSLVKAAYEAAHKIENEKARAQALLDVVNEINYFTQHPEN